MKNYFELYYIDKLYGESYIITEIAYVISTVILLNDITFSVKGILRKVVEISVGVGCMMALNAILYVTLGSTYKDWLPLLIFLLGYGIFFSKYKISSKIVFIAVFYSSTFLNMVISEPWGELFDIFGYAGVTSVITVALFFLITWYLKKFSTEKLLFASESGMLLMVFVSIMAGVSQFIYDLIIQNEIIEYKLYHVIIAGCFWLLELLTYYLFYLASKEYGENMELMTMQKKVELDKNIYEATKAIYEEMSTVRHEMKNHDTYMRALLENKEYEKLGEFLMLSQTESKEFYQYLNCGNIVINTIVNYEASVAKVQGIMLKSEVLVSKELPIRENDMSSLLLNLLNNAIEACMSKDVKEPIIKLNIKEKGAYLFIRVQNPVDSNISAPERLKLNSTKENKKLHGYGTKVIKMIVERYGGHVKYSIENQIFTAYVMMELGGKKNGIHADSNL